MNGAKSIGITVLLIRREHWPHIVLSLVGFNSNAKTVTSVSGSAIHVINVHGSMDWKMSSATLAGQSLQAIKLLAVIRAKSQNPRKQQYREQETQNTIAWPYPKISRESVVIVSTSPNGPLIEERLELIIVMEAIHQQKSCHEICTK